MNTSRALRLLPLLGAFALAACDNADTTSPFTDTTSMDVEDQIALEVLAEPGTFEAALALGDVPITTRSRRGMGQAMRNQALGDMTQARTRLQDASNALAAHDPIRATQRAREARQLVAGVALALGGPETAAAMIARLDGLALQVQAAPECFNDPYGLQGEMAALGERARARLHAGDTVGAMDRALLGEQRLRQRIRNPGALYGGAETAVALGDVAVSLANRIVTDAGGATTEQQEALDDAAEYATQAHEALDAGDDATAIHLANLAEWAGLDAVTGADGVSDDEARAILELAEAAYTTAAADPALTEVETALLGRARTLIDAGAAALETASPRGVGALWRALVISTWIAG